ncbi:PaaI family thioesterase [Actinoplanes subtropicus]|uniref:PaaI family thioesterase n=1 Tax=Actinoplanes subtropicus TaxID=543632 RepID=UPI00068AC242|nr:hotdog fold thioesterase [Actinoplanes subtropicus]
MRPDDRPTGRHIDPVIKELMLGESSLEWFGFEILEATGGSATVTLVARDGQLNGAGVVHGGIVFALADQAFAAAALTVLGAAVTGDAAIQYLAPSGGESVLTAQARTSYCDGRRAVIDVDVVADDRIVALYRGTARAVRRPR